MGQEDDWDHNVAPRPTPPDVTVAEVRDYARTSSRTTGPGAPQTEASANGCMYSGVLVLTRTRAAGTAPPPFAWPGQRPDRNSQRDDDGSLTEPERRVGAEEIRAAVGPRRKGPEELSPSPLRMVFR